MFTDTGDDKAVFQLGDQALQDAATKSGVLDKAKDNTRSMLTALFQKLGSTKVTITFTEPTPPLP